ncbi:unnamed protein product [Prorocentrum cordatum]|uniref:Uncharacterized protein n=1 Tax=Prorocentrum cordatum TaxID=2364126 RepID=A0ABN9XXS3_9DINO|nr:unnamed protein product [Polarella glacialis]
MCIQLPGTCQARQARGIRGKGVRIEPPLLGGRCDTGSELDANHREGEWSARSKKRREGGGEPKSRVRQNGRRLALPTTRVSLYDVPNYCSLGHQKKCRAPRNRRLTAAAARG